MIAIIQSGVVHSTYNDDKAGILFGMFPLSEIEYVSTPVELGRPLPSRTAEQLASDNRRMRELAYSALTDKLFIEAFRENDADKKAAAIEIVNQIKLRYPV